MPAQRTNEFELSCCIWSSPHRYCQTVQFLKRVPFTCIHKFSTLNQAKQKVLVCCKASQLLCASCPCFTGFRSTHVQAHVVLLAEVTMYPTAFRARMIAAACCTLQYCYLFLQRYFTFHTFHNATSAQRWRGLLHTFIKQTQWQMPNKRATKCDQHPPVCSTVLSCIALLTDCIVFDVYRASQACDRHPLHLQ